MQNRMALAGMMALAMLFTFESIGCSHSSDSELAQARGSSGRPTTWATPIQRPGLDNTYQLDPQIYRGAQPTAAGFQQLEAMGVKTIVSLRATDQDAPLLQGTHLRYVWIPMHAFRPDDAAMEHFLLVTADSRQTPFFVHCEHGSDRTGAAIALYRVVHQGWSKSDALAEMRGGDYGFHDLLFQNLVAYVQDFDVEGFRQRHSLPRPASPARTIP
jgi:protein tyrosine/serine phosphatase